MNWHPHSLFHCLDSDFMAWATIVLCLGVLAGYVLIAVKTWLPSLRVASPEASKALLFMMMIFVFCAVAGYGTVALAAVAPKTAYVSRVIFLVLVNVVNVGFVISKQGKEFRMIGRSEALGARFRVAMKDSAHMSDHEIAETSRKLAVEFFERKAQAL